MTLRSTSSFTSHGPCEAVGVAGEVHTCRAVGVPGRSGGRPHRRSRPTPVRWDQPGLVDCCSQRSLRPSRQPLLARAARGRHHSALDRCQRRHERGRSRAGARAGDRYHQHRSDSECPGRRAERRRAARRRHCAAGNGAAVGAERRRRARSHRVPNRRSPAPGPPRAGRTINSSTQNCGCCPTRAASTPTTLSTAWRRHTDGPGRPPVPDADVGTTIAASRGEVDPPSVVVNATIRLDDHRGPRLGGVRPYRRLCVPQSPPKGLGAISVLKVPLSRPCTAHGRETGTPSTCFAPKQAAQRWDWVVLVWYPSRAAFVAMMTSAEYATANIDRENAIEDHVILAANESYSKLRPGA